jgi:WD40 repeat protein
LKLEGLVAKGRDSRYEPGVRSMAWQKFRLNLSQEFVVGTYSPGNAELSRAAQVSRLVAQFNHNAAVGSAAFSADGHRIVTAASDRTACVWEATTGKQIARLIHTDVVTSAAFSADGGRIVTASSDRTARVWEPRNGSNGCRIFAYGIPRALLPLRTGGDE